MTDWVFEQVVVRVPAGKATMRMIAAKVRCSRAG
jgi:hypothetical protein